MKNLRVVKEEEIRYVKNTAPQYKKICSHSIDTAWCFLNAFERVTLSLHKKDKLRYRNKEPWKSVQISNACYKCACVCEKN
jgi:hypothetical protein